MAEYKYRALGWQDDDIASLNVVDGTAADNQVELQITKQGEGGKISGPAIKGENGITIDATDPNTVKISGSGLVQSVATDFSIVYGRANNTDTTIKYSGYPSGNTIPLRLPDGRLQAIAPTEDLDCTNKKYADEHYVQQISTVTQDSRVYGLTAGGEQVVFRLSQNVPEYGNVAQYADGANIRTNEPINDLDCTNKKFVNDNYVKKATAANRVYITDKDGLADTAALAYTPIAYGLSAYDEGGRITTNEPVDNLDCANKKFVEDAVAAGSATVDGTSIVKDTDGKIQLNQEYIDYLDNQLYQPPAILVFTMLDADGAALPTSNELGTTLSATAFNHQETNIKNIQGDNVELHINNAAAATTSTAKKDVATKVTLTTAQSITNSTKFTLKGTNTKGATFSRDYQVSFYRYAYTATTDATTAPTSGATQQAAVSTFASNGSTFDYTKGGDRKSVV